MHAAGSSQILFFPAYPEQNRITKDGVQYVEGVPIAESIFGNDRLDPVISSFIPEILASETEAHIQVVTGDKSWDEEGQRQTIYIFDAVNEEQLYKHILKAKAHNRMRQLQAAPDLPKSWLKSCRAPGRGRRLSTPMINCLQYAEALTG